MVQGSGSRPRPTQGYADPHLRVDNKRPAVLNFPLLGLMHQGLVAGDGHTIDGLGQLHREARPSAGWPWPLPSLAHSRGPTHHQDLPAAVLVLGQQPLSVGHQPLLPGRLLPQLRRPHPPRPLLQLLL